MLGDYNVVALFNWEDKTKTISFTTEELGIHTDGKYLLYEFWTEEGYGEIEEKMEAKIPAHSVRLFAMHPLKNIPQWISSDRHITQNALEMKEYEWVSGSQTLEGKIELIGSFSLTTRLYVPNGFSLSGAECDGAKCTIREEGNNMVAVLFRPVRTGNFKFKIRF